MFFALKGLNHSPIIFIHQTLSGKGDDKLKLKVGVNFLWHLLEIAILILYIRQCVRKSFGVFYQC